MMKSIDTNSGGTETVNEPGILERYQRAAALEQEGMIDSMVLNGKVVPHWLTDGEADCFWYRRQLRRDDEQTPGTEYRLVNAAANTNDPAFDHDALAQALGAAVKQALDAAALPLSGVELDSNGGALSFAAFDRRWRFDGELTEIAQPIVHPADRLVSPDGKRAVYRKNHNVWMCDIDSGTETALTQSGEPHYAYAVKPAARNLMQGPEEPAMGAIEALWSPDSNFLLTVQTDERDVRAVPSMVYVPRDGSVAPTTVECRYALPGDQVTAQYRFVIIDVVNAKEIALDHPPVDDAFVMSGPFSGNRAWWSADGETAYFLDVSRGQRQARVIAANARSGESRLVFEESSDTYLDLCPEPSCPAMLTPLPETGELLWYSERSGWGHFYRYDLSTGECKGAVTSGDFLVRGVVHLDEKNREIWLSIAGRVSGRNPYYREIVRVDIDSTAMTVMVSSDHDYLTHYVSNGSDLGVAPSGKHFVAIRCRVDEAPVVELRNRQGELIQVIETADTAGLPQGWVWPQAHALKADDGETEIDAVVFRPSHFDPDKQYPVLQFAIDSPMYSGTPTGAFVGGLPMFRGISDMAFVGNTYFTAHAALAELGFIVVAMGGRGTPLRSKAFHEADYGDLMQTQGVADYVTAVKQLAAIYPAMDLDRVGLVCTDSPSNVAIYGLLLHPEFYKVGVAFSPWDPRLVKQGEVYHGILDEEAVRQPYLEAFADRLEGKLLLVSGLLDPFFHAACSFQIVDALNKANKPVDLFCPPNGGHGCAVVNAHCRAFDYVVTHLRGEEPPRGFKLETGLEQLIPGEFLERPAD